jgi:hypothetical protein
MSKNRRPSVATQNARLIEAGVNPDTVEAFTVKQRLEAFDRLLAGDAPVDVVDPDTGETEDEATPVKTKPAPANCGCGCGAPTITAKARFLSGHDARFAGQVGRGEVEPTPAQQAILDASPALAAKVEKVRLTAATKAAAKQAREVAKAAAKRAFDEAMAEALKA